MIRRPPRSTLSSSSAASDVYKRQVSTQSTGVADPAMARTPQGRRVSTPPVRRAALGDQTNSPSVRAPAQAKPSQLAEEFQKQTEIEAACRWLITPEGESDREGPAEQGAKPGASKTMTDWAEAWLRGDEAQAPAAEDEVGGSSAGSEPQDRTQESGCPSPETKQSQAAARMLTPEFNEREWRNSYEVASDTVPVDQILSTHQNSPSDDEAVCGVEPQRTSNSSLTEVVTMDHTPCPDSPAVEAHREGHVSDLEPQALFEKLVGGTAERRDSETWSSIPPDEEYTVLVADVKEPTQTVEEPECCMCIVS
eukprot:TRINITY_DN36873_c0_g1_i2.p1 TRINITY_DN36873_c0_g1~~TRINITY_DN36873_c0_g1_i2.p1  ORF type:complete len:309 (+),score=64.62 TRINITY_DN36873_c0_g1_i2:119-1045(+)